MHPIVTGGPKKCWCLTCWPMTVLDPTSMRMALCPTCGNKRCPKANNCANACTNSNEVGQAGSSLEHVKPFPKPYPGMTAGTAAPAVSGANDPRSTLMKFQLKEVARCKVSGQLGYIHGRIEIVGDEPKYLLLHLDDEGNRTLSEIPESHLEAQPPAVMPSFQNPYATISEGEDTPPGGPGGAGIAPGGIPA